MCFKYSLKLDIKRITIKIKMKLAVKVFITYLVRLWTNATEFFLSLTDLLTATYSYMCLVVPPWEWYLWCGVTACWDLFSEYRFCWFLTSVLSCEGYICYFIVPLRLFIRGVGYSNFDDVYIYSSSWRYYHAVAVLSQPTECQLTFRRTMLFPSSGGGDMFL